MMHGKIKSVRFQKKGADLLLEIEPMKSRIIVFDRSINGSEEVLQMPALQEQMKESVEFEGEWKRSICESIHYPEFEKEKEVRLPDHLAEEEPEFSGFVRYENYFTVSSGQYAYFLEIMDASEGVEVFVNGISQGIQIVPVFRYDLTSSLKEGINYIRIEVATTLERQMAQIPDFFGNKKESKALSGITGEVRLWKMVKDQ